MWAMSFMLPSAALERRANLYLEMAMTGRKSK
jgi:hypothetical protein